MGTKKGQRRKTARRAYEPRRPQKSKNGRRKRERTEGLIKGLEVSPAKLRRYMQIITRRK